MVVETDVIADFSYSLEKMFVLSKNHFITCEIPNKSPFKGKY